MGGTIIVMGFDDSHDKLGTGNTKRIAGVIAVAVNGVGGSGNSISVHVLPDIRRGRVKRIDDSEGVKRHIKQLETTKALEKAGLSGSSTASILINARVYANLDDNNRANQLEITKDNLRVVKEMADELADDGITASQALAKIRDELSDGVDDLPVFV